MTAPSLNGRVFVDATSNPAGDVGTETRFEYHQDGDIVWARYSGGAVRLGFLVGVRTGSELEFRYSHVVDDGTVASGHCRSRIVERPDGALECHETWEWTSKPGSGTSIIRELPAQG